MAKVTADEKEWRAESDLSTLVEAEKIKVDKARLSAAMALKKERMAALEKVGEKK
jgi:hypothetical protein